MIIILLLVVSVQTIYGQRDIASSRNNAITRAIKQVVPSVVGINVVSMKEFSYSNPFMNDDFFSQFFPRNRYYDKVKGLGSGFIISDDGYILTNQHVVQNAIEIIVTLTDGTKYPAQIIGLDRVTDLALLKIKPEKKIKPLKFGNSDDVIIGEWVMALGNPFGLFDINNQPTVTVGVISATNRDFGMVDGEHVYQNMLQTDAAINGGNSGGPLVNSEGEVIGINTFIYSGGGGKTNIGIGFAIPINRVARILDDLKTRGAVDRSFSTGFRYQPVDRMIAQYMGLTQVAGVVVTDINKDGPAEKAGLQVSDVILKINGFSVNNEYDMQKIVLGEDLRVDDTIQLDILRDKKTSKIKLKLGKR